MGEKSHRWAADAERADASGKRPSTRAKTKKSFA
jgi:hypothetical protein